MPIVTQQNVSAAITLTFTTSYQGAHTVCYKINGASSYTCQNVNCSSSPCSVLIPITLDIARCGDILIEGYVRPGCDESGNSDVYFSKVVPNDYDNQCKKFEIECKPGIQSITLNNPINLGYLVGWGDVSLVNGSGEIDVSSCGSNAVISPIIDCNTSLTVYQNGPNVDAGDILIRVCYQFNQATCNNYIYNINFPTYLPEPICSDTFDYTNPSLQFNPTCGIGSPIFANIQIRNGQIVSFVLNTNDLGCVRNGCTYTASLGDGEICTVTISFKVQVNRTCTLTGFNVSNSGFGYDCSVTGADLVFPIFVCNPTAGVSYSGQTSVTNSSISIQLKKCDTSNPFYLNFVQNLSDCLGNNFSANGYSPIANILTNGLSCGEKVQLCTTQELRAIRNDEYKGCSATVGIYKKGFLIRFLGSCCSSCNNVSLGAFIPQQTDIVYSQTCEGIINIFNNLASNQVLGCLSTIIPSNATIPVVTGTTCTTNKPMP